MELLTGDKLGKYEIVGRIAAGGMAEVYLARSLGVGAFVKLVALKRMLPELACEPGFREMFMQEAAVAARLSHPNIVQIFDFAEERGELYLAMELVQGVTLRKLLADGLARGVGHCESRLTPLLSAQICSCIARALDHAWRVPDEQGKPSHLIHRDVSPHNILVSFAGDTKLADFGIARPAERRTSVGVLKGKLLYMSPEQILGGPLDARADVFALGIVLYESAMSLTRPLFDAKDESKVKTAVQSKSIPVPSRMNPDFPASLSSVIMKALERDPEKRFQSAAEMDRALRECIYRESKDPQDYDLAMFMQRVYPNPPQICAQRRESPPDPEPAQEPAGAAPARSALELCANDPNAETIAREEVAKLQAVAPPTPLRKATRCDRAGPARPDAAVAVPAQALKEAASSVPEPSRARSMILGRKGWAFAICGVALAFCASVLALSAPWRQGTKAADAIPPTVLFDGGARVAGGEPQPGLASAEAPDVKPSLNESAPPTVERASREETSAAAAVLKGTAEPEVDGEKARRQAVASSSLEKAEEKKSNPNSSGPEPSRGGPVAAAKAERRSGFLVVYIKPWGSVWVDSESSTGKQDQEASPILRRSLNAGRHVVHVQEPSGELHHVNVVIKADRETRLEAPFKGASGK